MKNLKLLWIDDEVDMLKPFVIFLNSKGYKVQTVSNGPDALSLISPFSSIIFSVAVNNSSGK